ncbi:hypothetical protein [Neisseria sp. Ec49-e6-T10]|uniref:hypothetical protein n=1 Tax=Neisseria sp. Ec49-e6-T10 TaxID=3140744 RepID=UPI003EBB2587
MAIIFILPLLLLLFFLLYRHKQEQNFHKKHQLVTQYLQTHCHDSLIFSKKNIPVDQDLPRKNGFFDMNKCDVFVFTDFMVILGYNNTRKNKQTECPPVIITAQNHTKLEPIKYWAEIVQPQKVAFSGTDSIQLLLHYIVPNRPEYKLKGKDQFFDPFCTCILTGFSHEEYTQFSFIKDWQVK